MSPDDRETSPLQPSELPIDGTLDLHMFAPREVKDLVEHYIAACLERNIHELRIVHGKGIGTLRTIVHSILADHPAVLWYGHRSDAGSWGATLVHLRPESGGGSEDGSASSDSQ